jgi:Holliday junction DNA helicase RuvB
MERNEINGVAPTSLAHLIGQRSVVEQVRVALDAAQMDGLPFPSTLCVGAAGCGKTQTAKVIAAEMCSEFHEVLGQAIQSPADFNALLLGAKVKDVVFIDEAHELEKEFQTALYIALDQKRVFLQGGRPGRTPQSIPLASFSLLLATTDEFKLLETVPYRGVCSHVRLYAPLGWLRYFPPFFSYPRRGQCEQAFPYGTVSYNRFGTG